ncbi:MAG: DMT family transporter [Gammaproteobacteria bacterium]|nr:DMT family transporter [Gammaproteobacteria bacterium]
MANSNSAKPAKVHSLALPALLLGATAIGMAPIFVRLSEVGPVATAFYRLLLALPLLGLWWAWERRAQPTPRPKLDRQTRRWLIAAGVCFAGDLGVWHWSLMLTSVANATLLTNLAPVFVAAISLWFFRERVSGRLLLALIVALAGAALLMGQSLAFDRTRLLGDALGLCTAVFYAGYIVSVVRLRSSVSTATVMFVSGLITAAVLLPFALASGEDIWPELWQGWAVLLGLAIVSHVGGQGLIAWALAHLSAAFGSVSLLWQPVAATLFAWLVLRESIGVLQALGGVLVLAGIFLARRAELQRRMS